MKRDEIRMRVSDARLNDLCYMILKKLFFEPAGLGNPRGCDIRVCMDMAALETRQPTLQAAILLPDEQPSTDHEPRHDVEFGQVFDVCLAYLEDHWMKQSFEQAYSDPTVRQKMWDFCAAPGSVFQVMQELAEERCAAAG